MAAYLLAQKYQTALIDKSLLLVIFIINNISVIFLFFKVLLGILQKFMIILIRCYAYSRLLILRTV